MTSLVMRLVHVWQMRDTLFFSVLMGDSRGYDSWALQIAAGDWIGREVFYQAPLYPYFLGLVYTLFGHDLLTLRVIQAALGAASCIAASLAAARLVSPRAGLIAGLMLAVYPPAIFFDGLIQKSVLDVFFVCVSLAIIAGLVTGPPTPRRWLLLGITMGALALTRKNALVLIGVVAAWATATKDTTDAKDTKVKKSKKVHERSLVPIVPIVSFVCGVGVILLPVAIRNYAVGGGLHLTTSQFGSNLYIGNNPRADGSYVALREGRGSPEFERLDATELAEEATGTKLTPGDVSSYWTRQTLAYIRARPLDWLQLLARKAWLLVSSTETIDTESQESHAEYSWPLRVLGHVWHFGVLLPIAIAGACLLWPQRQRLSIVYALAMAYAATLLLFFVVARYRLALVPFVIVIAAGGIATLVDGWRRASPRLGIPAGVWAAIAVAAIVSNWPWHTAASQMAITENNLGTALQESNQPDAAVERYRRALALNPQYTPAINNLGTALRATGRVTEALAAYDQAIAARPQDGTAYVNKGNALMALGKTTEAIAAFRRAIVLAPRSQHPRTALAHALYDEGTLAIEAGNFSRAASTLREAIALKPDYAEAHNNLGIALASLGNVRDAVTEWETALRLNPNLQDARRNLELARKSAR